LHRALVVARKEDDLDALLTKQLDRTSSLGTDRIRDEDDADNSLVDSDDHATRGELG